MGPTDANLRERISAIDQEIDDIFSSYREHECIRKHDRIRLDELEAERSTLKPPRQKPVDWEKRERIARELSR